jgi:hypothetical protein
MILDCDAVSVTDSRVFVVYAREAAVVAYTCGTSMIGLHRSSRSVQFPHAVSWPNQRSLAFHEGGTQRVASERVEGR